MEISNALSVLNLFVNKIGVCEIASTEDSKAYVISLRSNNLISIQGYYTKEFVRNVSEAFDDISFKVKGSGYLETLITFKGIVFEIVLT